jgi:hypothetical protein
MSYDDAIVELESEWSPDSGFFWLIRQGNFAASEFERALKKVSSISISENAELPRRLVSLLWYVPIFMHWQTDRVREAKGDLVAYGKATTAMHNENERLLGVP